MTHYAPSIPSPSSSVLSGLAPGMLVAVPALHDPMFEHAVILLVEAGPQGGYGMVINRQAPVDLATLLEGAGIPHTVPGRGTVWFGGPVQPQSGLVLYLDQPGLPDYEPQARVLPGLRMSSSMDLLHDVARGRGPQQFALYLGRASWSAGQLEAELAAGIWLPAEPDMSLLFPTDAESCWRRALGNLGADPLTVVAPAEA